MPSPKKEPIRVDPILSEKQIEETTFDLTSQSLEAQAISSLKPEMVRILKKIAYYTSKVGLPLNEACMLVDIDFEKFKEEMKTNPVIAKIIRSKELEYKKDLMYTISQKAKSGDDKLAQWLLERRYPDEFAASKRKGGDDDDEGLFVEAIEFIRKNGDSNPLVSETSGRAIVVSKGQPKKSIKERITNILG